MSHGENNSTTSIRFMETTSEKHFGVVLAGKSDTQTRIARAAGSPLPIQ